MKYKVIVAGSRGFNDYPLLKETLKVFLKGMRPSEIEIVSGEARGADKLGEKFALEHNIAIKRFPADWNNLGRAAGHIRNGEMADYANACVVFWDGVSRGSEGMIKIAKRKELELKVVVWI